VSVTLFGQNLLADAAALTVSPAALATKPLSRIADGDRGPQYEGGSVAQADIDIDLGSAQSVEGWALVNHNASGVTVTLYGSSTSPATDVRDSFAATGADVLRTFAALSFRYWRIRIPALASAPLIGEALLGVPRVITDNPFLDRRRRATVGNVHRDRSPGGYAWAVQRGAQRTRLSWGWSALSDANLARLEAAYDDTEQGATKLLVQDELGALRWMDWTDAELEFAAIGAGLNEAAIVLEQAL
jgi:hypothetical protein